MQTRIDRDTRKARYWFDSLAELARYLDDTKPTWRGRQSVSHSPERSWDLKAGYEGAWSLARNGWNEGAQRSQEALKAFQPKEIAVNTRVDFYGHMPHVPRYCAGAPDSMIRYERREGSAPKVLSLVVPVNALSHVDASHMANFGVAVAQYINQMEADNIRCEVIGAIVSKVSGWRVAHCWRIKHADQPLDLAVMAFAIGHPAMFRRLGFALRERCAAPEQHNYGESVAAVLEDVINVPSGAVILNGMRNADDCARTPHDALEYISRQIERAIDNPEAD